MKCCRARSASPKGLSCSPGLVPFVADEQPRRELARDNVFGLEPLA
jgi:hypothetical protein